MKSIAVFCGSNEGHDPEIIKTAYNLGETLATEGITLVYGAGKLGLMGQVANGALDKGGKVIGVIPEFLKKKELVHTGITNLYVTTNMHERKLMMNDFSEGVITLPGGFGTMDEMFEIITWAQLGLHQKPIGILNISGFYDELLQLLKSMVDKGFLKPENFDLLLVEDSIEKLLNAMKNYKPAAVPKWITKEQI